MYVEYIGDIDLEPSSKLLNLFKKGETEPQIPQSLFRQMYFIQQFAKVFLIWY